MKPLPPGYLARKLMNTAVPWTQPHHDQPGFARIDVAARLEDVLPQLAASVPPGEESAAFGRLAKTLRLLKTTEEVDRSSLIRGAAMLTPLIERAREAEETHRDAADPDHPVMRMLREQENPPFFQMKDAVYRHYEAQARRVALETLRDGLAAIGRAFGEPPPREARGR